MRSYFISLSLLALAICLALSACDKSVKYQPVDPQADLKKQISHSPRPDEEAEHMALWLGGEVVAHDTLYEKLKNATALVRNTFRDTVPYLDSMGFVLFCRDDYLMLMMSSDAVQGALEGNYYQWDDLNSLYRATSIDISSRGVHNLKFVYLRFKGRLNPIVLGSLYVELDGVVDTEIGSSGFPDRGNIYPWITDDGITFLLRKAWGDCTAGCMYSHFWYFKVKDSGAEYVGDYLADYTTEPPDWWEEARVAMDAWMHAELPE